MLKHITKSLIAYVVFIGSILAYSICFRRTIDDANFLWMIWGFSHYITFFISTVFIIKVVNHLKNSNQLKIKVIFIVNSIIILILGYYLSVVDENYFIIVFVSEVILSFLPIMFGYIFIKKYYVREEETPIIDKSKNVIEEDCLNYYKGDASSETKNRMPTNFALCFSVVVYASFLAYIVFANIVCHDVKIPHIVFETVLGVTALLSNQMKLSKYQPHNWKRSLLENGLLVVALITYIIVEWIFLPVTFNIFLVGFSAVLIIPIHITQIKLTKTYHDNY